MPELEREVGPLLAGKVAVVTGGAGGIGRGISEAFAAHGATVLVVDIDHDRTDATVARLHELAELSGSPRSGDAAASPSSPSSGLVVDVRDAGIGPLVVGTALERQGRLDVLVNNVGHFVHPGRSFVDTTEDEWQDLFTMNLQHVLRMTHAALPPMIEQGDGGSIVNLTTVEAFRGIPHHPVYAAYKAAVTQFGRSLALDVGRHAIRVNDIAPDVTRSLQLPYEKWLTEEDEARIPTWVPMGRLGEPSDPAGAAVFLASDLSSFVTGTTIHCDGGTYAAGGWYRSGQDDRGWTNRPRDP